MTLIKQNAFQLSEVTSTNSLINGGKARKVSSCMQYMCCHHAQLYPLLPDSRFQHQSSLQTGYFKTTSNSTIIESNSVLSLPKYSDLKCDNLRRTVILTPISLHLSPNPNCWEDQTQSIAYLLIRLTDKENLNYSEPSTKDAETNEK
jgi:hypothetical protein